VTRRFLTYEGGLVFSLACSTSAFCQTVVQNPAATQTITQPSGTNFNVRGTASISQAVQFADPAQAGSVSAAIGRLPATVTQNPKTRQSES
jgi:hypothetical protein